MSNGKSRGARLRPVGFVVLAFLAGVAFQSQVPAGHVVQRLRWELESRIGGRHDTGPPPGHWGRAQDTATDRKLTREQQAEMDRLLSIGYTGGSRPAVARSGVTYHDTTSASDNLRLYASGHAASAEMIDATGRVLHRWEYSYDRCREDGARAGLDFLPDTEDVTECWRRVRLLPGGDLLAIFEGHGLVRIDRDSQPVWSYPGHCHHDLDILPDGRIAVLTREAAVVERIHPEKPVLLDAITLLTPDGEQVDRIDLLTAFENSDYAPLLTGAHDSGDLFHTNTLEYLDGRGADRLPALAEGNFLISVRELDTIAVVDPRTRRVVWAMSGMWHRQHQPTLLDNGDLLVFDNLGRNDRSRVLEFDPLTHRIAWSYTDGPATPLFSGTCGSNQRLPNGNTMITESDNGRALEVTPDGRIAWEYRNPRRTGPQDQWVAAIMEMVVLPADFDPSWVR